MSPAYRFMVSTVTLILCAIGQLAVSEDAGATQVDVQNQMRRSLNPPPISQRRNLLCDSLGAATCFRALAHQAGQEPSLKATPPRPQ
jgi:hypothetical protein